MSTIDRESLTLVIFGGMKESSAHVSRLNLNDFARYLGIEPSGLMAEDAIVMLIGMAEEDMNRTVAGYQAHLRGRVKPTVGVRRIGAIKSAWKRAIDADLTRNRLKVENPGVVPGRREFPAEDLRRFLDQAEAEAKGGGRDHAIILLFYERLLRRHEIAELDWPADVDLKKSAILVGGKPLAINPACQAAIRRWLEGRGKDWAGPLFSPRGSRGRISEHAMNHMINVIGRRAGIKFRVSPQLLRQASIDRVIELGWDLRSILEFCRFSVMSLKRHVARMPRRPKIVGLDVIGIPEAIEPNAEYEVILGSSYLDPAIIGGEIQPRLTEAEFDILVVLKKYESNIIGISYSRLEKESKHKQPEKIAKKLIAKTPRWGTVIHFPGGKGKGGIRLGPPMNTIP